MHDLNNYFKKKDLLGGLTEPEKAQLRANIGVWNSANESGETKPVEISSNSLYNLVRTKTLTPGTRYQITDF